MTPDKIGKYQILGKLGQGAMGEVLRGHDPVLNRDVAIKRISSGLDADETLRKRFEREARAVASLSHPHIITVYELGFEGQQMFMAMELLEGIDLKLAMAQHKLSFSDKLAVMEQICEGLSFAHERDLVHRDLKPANIHILPNGKVKIMDFGLARMSGSDMTSTGTVMGTPHYMSPEQVRGQKADARSDVFALGCVFYELLTGRKPFDAESMHGVLFKVMQEEPTPLAEVAPDVPQPLMHVVERALSKDAAERFQSAGELLNALRLARAAGATTVSRPADRPTGERTVVSTPQAPRDSARSASRSGTRAPGSSVHRPTSGHGMRNLLIGLGAGVVVVVLVLLALRPMLGGPREPEPPPQVAALVQAAVATRVEVAQRRLDSLDYAAAVREAESALKMAPNSAEAKALLTEASDMVRRSEAAATALQQAQAQGGDIAMAAFELMKVDPASPDAQKALSSAGASFRPRAEEAQRLAAEAEKVADAAGGSRQTSFTAARTLADQGRQALQSGQFVNAARRFLEARLRFERAGRSAGRS